VGVQANFMECKKSLSLQDGCDVEIFVPLYINEYLKMISGIRGPKEKI
jgi:hypothetical protein